MKTRLALSSFALVLCTVPSMWARAQQPPEAPSVPTAEPTPMATPSEATNEATTAEAAGAPTGATAETNAEEAPEADEDAASLELKAGEAMPAPPVEEAEPVTRVEWNPSWRKAGFWDAVTIGVGAVVVIGDSQISSGEGQADWSKPILFDDSVRDLLRLDVAGQRDTAATISDFMMMGSLIHNVLFDNLVIAWVVHGEPSLAWQMSIMNAEAYAIALSLTAVVKTTSSRARPFVKECENDPEYSPSCNTATRYRSFFSGHAATTAVGAGLLCAHHLNVPLYDNGVMDVGTCVMGIGLTMATGALRIASDNHWATDVVTGHLVGFASGFLVPTLLYYHGHDEPDESSTDSGVRALVLPDAGPDHVGLQLVAFTP